MAKLILAPTTSAGKSDVFHVTDKPVYVRAHGAEFLGGEAHIEYLDVKGNWLPYSEGANNGLLGAGQNTNPVSAPGTYRVAKGTTTSVTGIELQR